MAKKIRFAPLIRVSTEGQEKKGESLLSQKTRIKDYVRYMGGTIPEYAWKYCGQEHSTPGYERKLFDQMIADCSKDLFDAIIVDDASRWARDVVKSKENLEVLKNNNIKLFIGMMEIDLFHPDPIFIFDMQVQVAEYYAQTRCYKSIVNKIHKAKRGMPTSGKLPYGRTFDKKAETWGIDDDKKRLIQRAARAYLKGDSFENVAKKVGMTHTRLIRVLKERCGDTWEVHFRTPRFKIDEKVKMTIPSLLPEATIKAIHERAESNRTWTHGPYTNQNLLSRFVFCAHCGSTLSSQTNNGIKYYRHGWRTPCKEFGSIRADILEDAVLVKLFSTFGDVKALEEAARRAIPNPQETNDLKAQIDENEKALKKIKKAKGRLIDAIEASCIDPDISERIQKYREQQDLLKAENRTLATRLSEIPTEETITKKVKQLKKMMIASPSKKSKRIKRTPKEYKAQMKLRMDESYFRGSPDRLVEMTFEQRRELVQTLFSGKDSEGNRFGVYLKKRNDSTQYDWFFTIKWDFISDEVGNLPMSKDRMRAILGIEDPDFDPIEGYIVDSVSSQNRT